MNQEAGIGRTVDQPISLRPGCTVLVIEARYYDDVSEELANGACAELDARKIRYHRITVPGALEIPQVLSAAVAEGLIPRSADRARYCGVVVLGCVIRGETSHYDIVCNNTNHWLMELSINHSVPLGNGVLTVDTHEQAMARAKGGRTGKGADAVRACLRLIELQLEFEEQSS